jgi:hypothetical protein
VKITLPAPDVAFQFPVAQQSRQMAADVVQAQRTISGRIRKHHQRIVELDEQLRTLPQKLIELTSEKVRVLAELKAGYYCSKCRRSKTEIERAGREGFHEHLARVDGQIIPATQDEIDQRAREFEEKIGEVRRLIDALKPEKARLLRHARQDWDQMRAGMTLWKLAVGLERDAIVAVNEADDKRLRRQRTEAQDRLLALDKKRISLLKQSNPEPALVKMLNQEIRLWEQTRDRATFELGINKDHGREMLQQAERAKLTDYEALRGLIRDASPFERYTAMPSLPNLSIDTGRLEITTTQSQIAVKFKFGEASAELVAAGDNSSTRVMAFLSLKDRLKVGTGVATKYGLDGVRTEVETGIGVGPAQGDTLAEDYAGLPLP